MRIDLAISLAALLAAACAAPPPATRTEAEVTHRPAESAQQRSQPAASAAQPEVAALRKVPELEPHQAEIAAVLGDVCRLGYDDSSGQVRVGCAECDLGAPFDASAWEVASPLGRIPYVMLAGGFSAPGADERFVALGGYCNPKHQAYVFLQRQGARWAVLTMREAHDQDNCKLLHRKDAADLVICTKSRDYIGGDSLDAVEAITPSSNDTLLELSHWRATMKKPRTRDLVDFSIESFEVRDVDGDGALDIDVSLRERSFPIGEWKSETEELPFGDLAKGHQRQVVISGRKGKLVIDAPASRDLVRRMHARLPPLHTQ